MRSFQDSKQRPWDITVDPISLEKVRNAIDVKLENLFTEEGQKLFANPVLMVKVLWLLCEEQATGRKVEPEDFGRSMVGDALDDAAQALTESVLDFFPTGRRKVFRATVEKSREIAAQMEDKAIKEIASMSFDSVIKSADMSASTPAT